MYFRTTKLTTRGYSKMAQEKSGIERRRFPRVSVNFVTVEVYSPVGEPQQPEMCFVVNLSENGMMIRSGCPLERGQRIRLTFTIPDREAVIRTDAVVIHGNELENSRFYGLQFRNLGLAELSVLKNFIESTLTT